MRITGDYGELKIENGRYYLNGTEVTSAEASDATGITLVSGKDHNGPIHVGSGPVITF